MMDSLMKNNKWARLLSYVTGLVNQELSLQKEYLAAENRSRLPPSKHAFNSTGSTETTIGIGTSQPIRGSDET
jgi:hypothetical protein